MLLLLLRWILFSIALKFLVLITSVEDLNFFSFHKSVNQNVPALFELLGCLPTAGPIQYTRQQFSSFSVASMVLCNDHPLLFKLFHNIFFNVPLISYRLVLLIPKNTSLFTRCRA